MKLTHIALLAACLASIGTMVAGLQHWQDALTPVFVGGVIVNVATQVGAILAQKPDNGRRDRRSTDRPSSGVRKPPSVTGGGPNGV